MGYSIDIELDYMATDPNNILGRHWRTRHGRFSKIKRDISLLTSGKAPEKPLTKFKISVIRRAGGLLDWDNYVASLKPVIDALILSGIIQNDSWKFIRHIDVDQVVTRKKEKKLFIKVEEIE